MEYLHNLNPAPVAGSIVRRVADSTQNQALNAILFLYRDVLKVTLPWLDDVQRAKKPHRLPVVLTRDEVKYLLAQLQGTTWLMAALVYSGGLRLLECLCNLANLTPKSAYP